jgi:hypothetical protein
MRSCVAGLLLAWLSLGPAWSQDADPQGECLPEEIDMGEYCARRLPEVRKLEPGAKRATPFRKRSMMPGQVGDPSSEPMAGLPRGTIESQDGHGFGVQLGAFSERSVANDVARSAAAAMGEPFYLAPLARGERILWACILGPFPDEASAMAALARVQDRTRYKDAFIKPLDQLKLVEVDHATTQE